MDISESFWKKVLLRKKYKEGGNKLLETIFELTMISLFGDTILHYIDYKYDFQTESWMETENDDGVE